MTFTLIRKLLRDARVGLIVTAVLLAAFQCLWARVTSRILSDLSPYFAQLAAMANQTLGDVQNQVFGGPGKIIRTIIGGERVDLDRAMDLLSIGYVHPLVQAIFCVWAVGRASGALAGEIDRGTMELLMAQPVSRPRLVLAHLGVDWVVIPLICLSLWGGTWLGTWLVGPIRPDTTDLKLSPLIAAAVKPEPEEQQRDRLHVDPAAFGPALPAVAGLLFAVSGYTMALSACGRNRMRVLGVAVFGTLVMFLVNVVGQLWDVMERLRPLTIFYYYQPQAIILAHSREELLQAMWGLAVLYGVGAAGYGVALWVFTRRDLPAPL